MSQKSNILAALKAGERLTPLDALERFGCMRLAARIGELLYDGWPIVKEDVVIRPGEPTQKTVAGYRLVGQMGLFKEAR